MRAGLRPKIGQLTVFAFGLRRLLRHEGRVGVVDVGRALEQLVGEHAGAGDDEHAGGDQADGDVAPVRARSARSARPSRAKALAIQARSTSGSCAPLGLCGNPVDQSLDRLLDRGDDDRADHGRSAASAPRRPSWCRRPRSSAPRCPRDLAPAAPTAPCRRSGWEPHRRSLPPASAGRPRSASESPRPRSARSHPPARALILRSGVSSE